VCLSGRELGVHGIEEDCVADFSREAEERRVRVLEVEDLLAVEF
jgi:hypothetical protein